MAQTVTYALLALLCFGINDFVFKRAAQRGATSHHIMMTLSLTMLPLIILYGLVTRSVVANPVALWGSFGAVFTYIGFYNFSRALKSGAVSIAAPVFRLSFVVTALLAVGFLAERMSLIKLAGLVLAVAAVWLLLGVSGGTRAEISREAIIWVLTATVCVGIAFFCFKLALFQGATPATVLICQTVALSTVATVASLFIDRRFAASRTAVGFGVLFGVIQTVGFAALLEGLASGEASILVPIAQLSFVVTALIGIAFLKESLTARKTAGLLAAVAAVGVLAMAARQ